MKVTLESTTKIVELLTDQGPIACRVWEGMSERGIPCHAFIPRVAVENGLHPSLRAQFEDELQKAHAAPTPAIAAIPRPADHVMPPLGGPPYPRPELPSVPDRQDLAMQMVLLNQAEILRALALLASETTSGGTRWNERLKWSADETDQLRRELYGDGAS